MRLSDAVAAVQVSRRRSLVFDIAPSPREPSTSRSLPLDEIRREPLHGHKRCGLRRLLGAGHVSLEAHASKASRGYESRHELVHVDVRYPIDEAKSPRHMPGTLLKSELL